MYFASVAWCFGTAGGGGAQGNKSVAGRESGWGEERSPSRSSCQTHGPASGPSPRSGQPGWPVPAHRTRARGLSAETEALRLRAQLSAAAGWLGGPRRALEQGSQGSRAQTAQWSSWLPRGTPCNPYLAKVQQHTPTPVFQSPTPGLHPRDQFKEGTTRLHLPTPRPSLRVSRFAQPLGVRESSRTERAAGGAHGLPQVPARGDSTEHLGDLELGEDLQELRGNPQGGVCLKGRTPLAPGVMGT